MDKQSDTLHPQLSRPLGREQAKVLEMVVTAPPETHTLSSRGCCFPKTVPVRCKGRDLKSSENQPLRSENRNKDNHLLSPLKIELMILSLKQRLVIPTVMSRMFPQQTPFPPTASCLSINQPRVAFFTCEPMSHLLSRMNGFIRAFLEYRTSLEYEHCSGASRDSN